MKWLIAILILLLCSPAYAGDFLDNHELSIGYAPGCVHWDSKDYNDSNNHLFMFILDDWFVSTFRNSFGNRSYSAGYIFRTRKFDLGNEFFARGNLPVGLVYGYDDKMSVSVKGVSPVAIPTLELGRGRFSVNTAIVPVVTVMFTLSF